MTEEDKEEEEKGELFPIVRYAKIEEDKKIYELRHLPTMREERPRPNVDPKHLNFETGASAAILQSIVGKDAIQKARAMNDQARKMVRMKEPV